MIEIDGSEGEGGGQVLRTALALSCIASMPFRIRNIRSKRRKPGLMRQHLTSVLAAAEISEAKVEGGEVGSAELAFSPRSVRSGDYHFSVGTAGSTMLVLQTVLPPLMLASGPSRVVLEGGTHNPMAPPFDFVVRVLLPLLPRMGPKVDATLTRYGFYPAGGGVASFTIQPTPGLTPLTLDERGEILGFSARAILSGLARHIGQRELDVLNAELGWPRESLHLDAVRESIGPGNVLCAEIVSEHCVEMVCGFGEKGVSAENVAKRVAGNVRKYLAAGVPVGEHLADQLLLPMALAGAGSFVTMPLSSHSKTNMTIIEKFLDVQFVCEEISRSKLRVVVEKH